MKEETVPNKKSVCLADVPPGTSSPEGNSVPLVQSGTGSASGPSLTPSFHELCDFWGRHTRGFSWGLLFDQQKKEIEAEVKEDKLKVFAEYLKAFGKDLPKPELIGWTL